MSAMELEQVSSSPLDTHASLIEETVRQQASIVTRQLRRWIPAEDVAQELRWWCTGHDAQLRSIWARTDGDESYRQRVLHVALKRQGWKIVTRMLAQLPPTHEAQAVLDQVAYSAGFVEEHLDVVWDPEAIHHRPQLMAAESADRVRTTRNPKSVDDWRLWILDVQEAFVRLPRRWQAILECLDHLGVTQDELAGHLGISQQRVSQIRSEAILRMARQLSGDVTGRRQPLRSSAVVREPVGTGRVLQVPAAATHHQVGELIYRGADTFQVLGITRHRDTGFVSLLVQLAEDETVQLDQKLRREEIERRCAAERVRRRAVQVLLLTRWHQAHPGWEQIHSEIPARDKARQVERARHEVELTERLSLS